MFGGRIETEKRSKHRLSVARMRIRLAAGLVLCLAACLFGPYLVTLGTLCFVASTVFGKEEPSRRMAATLPEDSVQFLALSSPQRIAFFLNVPSERIRATVLMALSRAKAFPKNANWTGVSPQLVEVAQTDESQHIRGLAAVAAGQAPVAASDVDQVLAQWKNLSQDTGPPARGLRTGLLASIVRSVPSAHGKILHHILQEVNAEDPQRWNLGLTWLARFFPDAPELGQVLKQLAGRKEAGRWMFSRSLNAALPYHFETVAQLLDGDVDQRVFALQLLGMRHREPFQIVTSQEVALLKVANQTASRLLAEGDSDQKEAAIEYFSRSGGLGQLLEAAAHSQGEARTAVLKRLCVQPWALLATNDRTQVDEGMEDLATILFDEATPLLQRQLIAKFFTQTIQFHTNRNGDVAPGSGPRNPNHRDHFVKLVADSEPEFRQLGLLYFLRVGEPSPEAVQVLIQAACTGESVDYWGTQILLKLYGNQGLHEVLLDHARKSVDGNGRLRGMAARYLVRHAIEEMPLTRVVQMYQRSPADSHLDMLGTVLEHPEVLKLHNQPKVFTKLRNDLFDKRGWIRLLESKHINRARDLLGAEAFDAKSMALFEQYLGQNDDQNRRYLYQLVASYKQASVYSDILVKLVEEGMNRPDPTLARFSVPMLSDSDVDRDRLHQLVEKALLYPDALVARASLNVIATHRLEGKRVQRLLREVTRDAHDPGTQVAAMTVWCRLYPSDPSLRQIIEQLSSHEDYGVRVTAQRLQKSLPHARTAL